VWWVLPQWVVLLFFHFFFQFLFAFFRFVLLLDQVSLAFLKLFFLLQVGSWIFLCLSEAAVLSVVLSPVICRQPGHYIHEHLLLWMVLASVCAVFSAIAFWRASSFALHSWSVVCEGSAVREILLSSSL
jgi:hypothetical protein